MEDFTRLLDGAAAERPPPVQLCTAPSTTNVLFLICNIHMLLFRRFSPSNSTDGIPFYVPPRECQEGSGTFNFFLTRCQAYYEILSTCKQQGLSRILLTLAFSFCLLFRTRLVVANESSVFLSLSNVLQPDDMEIQTLWAS